MVEVMEIDEAIKKIVPSLNDSINQKSGTIAVKIKDIKIALTKETNEQKFLNMEDKDIYWKIKLPLFHEGIQVMGGFMTRNGEAVIRMRKTIADLDFPPEPPEYDIPEIGLIISDKGLLNIP